MVNASRRSGSREFARRKMRTTATNFKTGDYGKIENRGCSQPAFTPELPQSAPIQPSSKPTLRYFLRQEWDENDGNQFSYRCFGA